MHKKSAPAGIRKSMNLTRGTSVKKKSAALIVFAFALISSASTFAVSMAPFDKYNLDEGAESLVFADGKVLSVTSAIPRCMAGAPRTRCLTRTTVALEIPLYGCLDDLIVSSNAVQDSRKKKVTLNVTALVVTNKRSLTAMCVRMPTRLIEIPITTTFDGLTEKNVDVVFQRRFNHQ